MHIRTVGLCTSVCAYVNTHECVCTLYVCHLTFLVESPGDVSFGSYETSKAWFPCRAADVKHLSARSLPGTPVGRAVVLHMVIRQIF